MVLDIEFNSTAQHSIKDYIKDGFEPSDVIDTLAAYIIDRLLIISNKQKVAVQFADDIYISGKIVSPIRKEAYIRLNFGKLVGKSLDTTLCRLSDLNQIKDFIRDCIDLYAQKPGEV